MFKTGLIALICIGCAALVCDSASATTIHLKGRLFPVETADVRGPFLPSRVEECEVFKEEAGLMAKEISQAHDQCLERYRGASGAGDSEMVLPDGRKVARCTVSYCQELHVARDEYGENAREAYARCVREVRGREQQTDSGRESGHSSSMERSDELEYGGERLFRGPKDGLWKYAKQEMAGAIDKYFGPLGRVGTHGLRAADATEFLWSSASKIREQCAAAQDEKVKDRCDQELIDAITTLPRKVPSEFRYDPVVELIQRAMMEKLQRIMRDVHGNLEEVRRGMEESAYNSVSRPIMPSRRGRTSPLIENR